MYEKHTPTVSATTKLNEFDTFITNTLQGWENDEDIHDYYNLTEAQNRLPATVYSSFRDLAEIMSHPDYDYMTYAYVVEFIERNDYDAADYLISTTWDQIYPYNLSMELEEDGSDNYVVGCGAIAVAQIMKYYQWPTSYSWNSMPSMLDWRTVSSETILSIFLAEVAQKVRQTGKAPNVSNANSMIDALINDFNYKSSCSKVNHNASLVASSLDDYGPVLMTGQNSGGGHAWICDGYGTSSGQIIYKLYVISPYENLEYITAGNPVSGDVLSNGTFFHLNWGWGGDYDGWYVSSSNTIPVIDGYTQQREDIINIIPNR